MAKKYWIGLAVITALAVGIKILTMSKEETVPSLRGAPVVSVSTFSLYEAAKAVAGSELEVRSIVPLGNDAHMFSPNPGQVAEVSRSSLFVYNGAGFESWAETMKNTLPSSVKVLNMSENMTLLKHDGDAEHEEHEDGHDHDGHAGKTDQEVHHHGAYDPHYWLDIDNMIIMTRVFETEFSQLNPQKASSFHKNAETYIGELEKLKSEFNNGLAECKIRTLVSNHDAFGYLAASNKLENISVIGLSSDEQPSAKTMAHVINIVKEHNIKTIFFEELINDNVSQAIAKEAGIRAVALQPLENISEDELKSHQTYLSIMRDNLAKLRDAMECR